jgi:hypothetical protein
VQVGVEERENLTVTGNVSITKRSLCVTLLAAILALGFVVILAADADARLVRRKKGVATFSTVFHSTDQPFEPPDRFSCSPGRPVTVVQPPKPIDGYICTAVGSVGSTQAPTFDLNDVLVRRQGTGPGLTPPPGPLATPDLFKCHWVPNAAGERFAENFSCEFPENQQTCVFTVNQLVATNIDEVDDKDRVVPGKEDLDQDGGVRHDLFLPLACHPLPTAVPAGDPAGEGSAAWLFGLVLAASGAMVGTVVIVRRRLLHDS